MPITQKRAKEVSKLVEEVGSDRACEQLGIKKESLKRYLRVEKEKKKITGTSTLYDKNGDVVMEWVKTSHKEENILDTIRIAVDEMKKEIVPRKPIDRTNHFNEDLLSAYIVTDYHLGQLSWGEETGEDWDVKIAKSMFLDWFSAAIQQTPKSNVAILTLLGDLLHWDGMEAVTPTGGNILDADTRFPRLVQTVIAIIQEAVIYLLNHHNKVHIIIAEGNHDMASSIWMRALFTALYQNEPSVTVDNTHLPYYMYEWGETSLFFHHGHKKKMEALPNVFAGMFREVYGRTKYSYGHVGHLHHKKLIENQMMEIEQHPTLAAKDAYASRGGWLSKRAASVITYHRKFGEVSRTTIRPEMILN